MTSDLERESSSVAEGGKGARATEQKASHRFARLTAASYPTRQAQDRIPPFDLRGTIEVISSSEVPNLARALAEQDTRPSLGSTAYVRAWDPRSDDSEKRESIRMPIRDLLSWTRLDGHLAIDRVIPRGMTLNLLLEGRKSKWRLVRGNFPKDEVVRGV